MKYQIEEPSDQDLFESSGHSHAAKAIEDVILNQENIHAIGLEGELGSGKSTILRLLEQKLPNDKFNFITFDVEQFHHSSTKASFIKHLSENFIQLFGSGNSKDDKKIKR
jgi:ABC-type polysaccharide/polyol phosphate transport system ATPase subunit